MNLRALFERSKYGYTTKRDALYLVTMIMALFSVVAYIIYAFVLKNDNEVICNHLIAFFAVCVLVLFVVRKVKSLRIISILFTLYVELVLMPVFMFYGYLNSSVIPLWYAACIMIMIFLLDKKDIWWVFIIDFYFTTYLYVNRYIFEKNSTVITSRYAYFFGFFVSFLLISVGFLLILGRMEKNFRTAEVEIDRSHEIEKNAGMAKSRFLANMSHEIRTPMNSIIGLSELVLKDDMDDVTRSEVTVIKQSAYDLLEIIDDVLMYSKLDSGNMKLLNVDFKLDEMLKSVISIISSNIAGKDLKIRIRLDHNIPKVLSGDDIRIKQIIMRLVFISLSLTDNGRLMLSVSCERDEEKKIANLRFVISDTGCGLSQVDLDAIYGVFDTYDSRQNSNLKGIGLKFSICKELLKMMGGTMDIRSIEGVGLESVIKFNVGIVDPEPMIAINVSEKKRVLIYISDNRELDSWKSIMENFRIRPDYANSYFSFDKALKGNEFDYVFVPCEVYASLSNVIESYKIENNTYVIGYNNNSYGDFGKCRFIRHPISGLVLLDVFNDIWKAEDYTNKNENIEYDASNAKILVVDDNGVNLKVAAGIFRSYGVEIDMAKSGEEALSKMENTAYHLVLMDMVMPELSGLETLNRMRNSNNKNMLDVPVVALTANTGGNIREEILEQGFQEYLAKPIKQRYLTQVLTTFLPPDVIKIKQSKEVKQTAKAKPAKETLKKAETSKSNIGLDIDFKKGLSAIANNEESYLLILNMFIKEGLGKIEDIKSALANEDFNLFTTLVHGVKSSSASIGATKLSEKYKELEELGKASNKEKIEELIKDNLESYKLSFTKIKDYLESKNAYNGPDLLEVSEAASTNASSEAEELIEGLKTAVNELNLIRCNECFEKLDAIEFEKSIKMKLSEAKNAFVYYDFIKIKELLASV